MDLTSPVNFASSSAEVPQQPDNSNCCGCATIANIDWLLHQLSLGNTPKYSKSGVQNNS